MIRIDELPLALVMPAEIGRSKPTDMGQIMMNARQSNRGGPFLKSSTVRS
jgi:hypothetical protein